jgi:hypothetical protein
VVEKSRLKPGLRTISFFQGRRPHDMNDSSDNESMKRDYGRYGNNGTKRKD